MTVEAFREQGYLQELNRRLLHPLGLALEVVVDEYGKERFGSIWDYRDDAEGLLYADEVMSSKDTKAKADKFKAEWKKKTTLRKKLVGYITQPLIKTRADAGGDSV